MRFLKDKIKLLLVGSRIPTKHIFVNFSFLMVKIKINQTWTNYRSLNPSQIVRGGAEREEVQPDEVNKFI